MGRIICITGTGLNIGKTAFSLALLLWAREKRLNAGYIKVVQCGSRLSPSEPFQGDAEWINSAIPDTFETSALYNFSDAVSPHLAAERAGAWLDPEWILDRVETTRRRLDFLIVEGSGGVATPYSREGLSIADVAARGKWPCLILGSPDLGTLHHTRTTAAFLQAAGAQMAGFAMSQVGPNTPDIYSDNRDLLSTLLHIPFMGILPFCPGLQKRLPLPPAMASILVQAIEKGISQGKLSP